MTTSRINLKISDTSSFRNLEVPLLDRTITRYFLSITRNSETGSQIVSFHVGNLVVSIRNMSKTPLVPMLRNTLTSLMICHMFIKIARWHRSTSALETRLSELSVNVPKMISKWSTTQLLRHLLEKQRILHTLLMFHCNPLIKIDYSPNLRATARSLILCELNSIKLAEDLGLIPSRDS